MDKTGVKLRFFFVEVTAVTVKEKVKGNLAMWYKLTFALSSKRDYKSFLHQTNSLKNTRWNEINSSQPAFLSQVPWIDDYWEITEILSTGCFVERFQNTIPESKNY